MKCLGKLKEKEKKELKLLMKESDISRVRIRAHAIILSSNRYSIEEISNIYEVDRDSVNSSLANNLFDILRNIGTKYRIIFS